MSQIPGLNIAISLDKSGLVPVMQVTDTTAYSAGVANNITGILIITQPDGVSVTGNFSTPDIAYLSGALNASEKELRLAGDANFQKGSYTITYIVRHPSFDETTITKSFTVDYSKPKLVIASAFDVFTPNLKVNDTTNYSLPNPSCTLQSVVREWAAASAAGNPVGGNVSQFDLSIANAYWDSEYTITLQSVISYTINASSYVTLIDLLAGNEVFDTIKPDALNTLFTSLTTYKNSIGNACKQDFPTRRANYTYAYTLFEHYKARGLCGDKADLVSMYTELKAVLNNGVTVPYTVTNTALVSYDFSNFCGCCDGGGGGVTLQITSQPQAASKQVGQSVTFSVTAVGTAVLTYQWRKAGSNIIGATSPNYTIATVASPDQALYDVVVTDGLSNTLTSNTAQLTVTAMINNVTTYWGWAASDPTSVMQSTDTITYQGNSVVQSGSDIVADYRTAPDFQFFYLKEPSTEPVKNIWFNTLSNNGVLNNSDDNYKNPFVNNGFRYYVSRRLMSMDHTSTTTYGH